MKLEFFIENILFSLAIYMFTTFLITVTMLVLGFNSIDFNPRINKFYLVHIHIKDGLFL